MATPYTYQTTISTIKTRVLEFLCADEEQINDGMTNFVYSDDEVYEMFQGNLGAVCHKNGGLLDYEAAINTTVDEITQDLAAQAADDSDYSDHNTAGRDYHDEGDMDVRASTGDPHLGAYGP